MRRSRLAASPPSAQSQNASSARPGRVSATGIPGPMVTGQSCRWAFSHTRAACSGMGQAISTWSRPVGAPSGPVALSSRAMRRKTSSTSASRPPAQNRARVPSAAGVPAGSMSSASRSASVAGAGATSSTGAASIAMRRGRSRPGSASTRGVTTVPPSASSSRRSSGVQMVVGSSSRRSPGRTGQTSRCWSASRNTSDRSASRRSARWRS